MLFVVVCGCVLVASYMLLVVRFGCMSLWVVVSCVWLLVVVVRLLSCVVFVCLLCVVVRRLLQFAVCCLVG